MASDTVSANVYVVSHNFKQVIRDFYAEDMPQTILGIRERLQRFYKLIGLETLYHPLSKEVMTRLAQGQASSEDFQMMHTCDLAKEYFVQGVLFVVVQTEVLEVIIVEKPNPARWKLKDVKNNFIELIAGEFSPDAVKAHLIEIKAPRKVSHDIFQRIQKLIPDRQLTVLEDAEPPEDGEALKKFKDEGYHFFQVASHGSGLWKLYVADIGANELVMGVFLIALAEARRGHTGYEFRFVNKEWPYNWRVLVQVKGEDNLRQYNPRSNGCLWRDQIPFWLMGVYSKDFRGTSNFSQLLLTGASLVKNYSSSPASFVLPLIYIEPNFMAKVIFMFSSEQKDRVLYVEEKLDLSDVVQAISFLNILYNQTDRVLSNHQELSIYGRNFLRQQSIIPTNRSVTTGTAQPDDEEQDQPDDEGQDSSGWSSSSSSPSGSASSAGLKRPGSPLEKPGTNITKHSSKSHFVKKVANSSFEFELLDEFMKLKYPNIIAPFRSEVSSDFTLFFFPYYTPFNNALCKPSDVVQEHLLNMSRDLANGLNFLHENGIAHLDVKPHNMVYDERFNLYLIDFDAAERVEGVQSTINEVRGTKLWMAPEVTKGTYSPILADRFSCGCVFSQINRFLRNQQLAEFSKKLQSKCPQDRPPIADWILPIVRRSFLPAVLSDSLGVYSC